MIAQHSTNNCNPIVEPVQKGTFPWRERGAAVERLDDAALVTLSHTRSVDGGSAPEEKVKLTSWNFEPWL